MMYKQTLQEVTYPDYPIQYPSSPSTCIKEIDRPDWDSLVSFLIQKPHKKIFYYNFSSLFEVDLSSINPHFEIKNETSLIEDIFEKMILENMLEFDIVVRIPPIKEWSARLKVKSIEKATPRVIEPEGF